MGELHFWILEEKVAMQEKEFWILEEEKVAMPQILPQLQLFSAPLKLEQIAIERSASKP